MNTPTRPAASASALNASPRTPQRGISSTFSSPGFRTEEDTVILEIGTRYLRAGLANDSSPRCLFEYGPEQSRRLGDFSKWLPGYGDRTRQLKSLETWSKDYELWQLDLRSFDLGLMEDKLERAFRTAFSQHLLLDAKGRKVVLVVPALTSHAVLSRLLNVLFSNLQVSTINLVPPPTMAVVAAGQRSGLVVDIGWHETIVTAVYEFREIQDLRSTRAMNRLLREVAILFGNRLAGRVVSKEGGEETDLDFEYIEELTTQLIWCRPSSEASPLGEETRETSLRLPLPSSKVMKILFAELSHPVEAALFADSTHQREQDDQEHTLDNLLYQALIRLPPDVRSICMSRIIFTGGGANIPGLKSRLLNDLESIVKRRGWDPVWKSSNLERDAKTPTIRHSNHRAKLTSLVQESSNGAAIEVQTNLPNEERYLRSNAKTTKPQVHGEIRGIETMGVFAGASLTAALHVKSLVEFERESFLQHGLLGPKKEQEASSARPRSLGSTLAKLNVSDHANSKLGAWA